MTNVTGGRFRLIKPVGSGPVAAPLPCLALAMTFLLLLVSPVFSGEQPNILVCLADDASWPHFGAYGCDWVHTPGFDRVAREGVLFTRAYTPNAKCAPSRACILTGRNSWQLKEVCNQGCGFPKEFKSYVEALADHGYFVGKTAKGWAPGKALDAQGKPRQLAGAPYDVLHTNPPADYLCEVDYAGNFEAFLKAKPDEQPFCFWYGSREPHRRYEYGVGIAKGRKRLEDIDHVPSYWPDIDTIRNDMLDYAFEIEYFDTHLRRMLELLRRHDLLDNTLVVVTSDNGMPFPRAKGQHYEQSNHMPLAVMWHRGIEHPGRVVDDYISFIDFAPTFLEVAGVSELESGMAPITGCSLTNILFSDKAGRVDPERDHVLVGRERHDPGRPNEVGYPIRGIVKNGFLYLHNFAPQRWPVGNPECGYPNCDASPTKTEILKLRRSGENPIFWQQSFGRRPAEELYNVAKDPDCLRNLAGNTDFAAVKIGLKEQLFAELKQQADPRMFGRGDVFDKYPYASRYWRDFYRRRFVEGENIPMGWLEPTDYDPDLKE